MKLLLKFNLISLLVMALGVAVSGWISRGFLQDVWSALNLFAQDEEVTAKEPMFQAPAPDIAASSSCDTSRGIFRC